MEGLLGASGCSGLWAGRSFRIHDNGLATGSWHTDSGSRCRHRFGTACLPQHRGQRTWARRRI
eukprot:1747245-Pyramimonas_sp.AAC.1